MDDTYFIRLKVGQVLQRNAQAEADATKEYTEQLAVIAEGITAAEAAGDTELVELLKRFYDATEEKISDELNHARSLHEEYVELTGIKTAED
nr:MAG TPA: hypothetical protein [Caudoviricetes sp.]